MDNPLLNPMADNTIHIDYVANLARIELTPEEKNAFSSQLGDILHYMDRLNTVDVEGVEPMAHAFPLTNVLGEDVPEPGFNAEEALSNAPARRDQQIVVPKVVEDA